jgi:L-ascorbate metabolism protein UlaG (beta-lactamase superfamily)
MRTFNKFYGLIFIIILFGFVNPKEELKITYLANCGYLYESGQSKVIIDPFGTEFGDFFYLPSNETKENIVQGNIPFENIDLLLITHIHGDHFNAQWAESFLLSHSKTKMICPSQVYRQMKDSCDNFAKIASQIISPDLSIYESKKIRIDGILLTVIRMQHGTDRSLEGLSFSDYTDYEKTENFGYVIHFDKKNIFHQGDGCLRINEKALKNIDYPVDIAYLGYFDWDAVAFNILKKDLKADTFIFMHGTKPAKELASESFKEVKPQMVFFLQELESKIFR